MDAETKIRKRAAGIVLEEDRRFSRGGKGRGFLTLVPGEKDEERRTRERDKLASWLESALKGKNPELLDSIKDEDIRKAYVEGTDPTVASKKLEFSAFRDLIEPKKGKRSWYDMNTEQLKYAMKERGFNEKEMPEFLQTLSEHQQNYDIGKAVDEDLSGVGGALKTIAFPVASREAVRQSYDKGSEPNYAALRGAGFLDAAALGGMLLAPGLKAFSGADELANIAKFGATDTGFEGARQFYDILRNGGVPTEENLKAPVYAGVAAATVPALSSFLGSYLTRGGSEAVKPFSQGFRRGSKGGMDSVKLEAENIKNKLIKAKEASKRGYDNATDYVKSQYELKNFDPTSDGYLKDQAAPFGKIDEGAEWAAGQKILMDLGYPSRESMLIEKAMKTRNNGIKDVDRNDFLERLGEMESDPANKSHGINMSDDNPLELSLDPQYAVNNASRFKLANKIDVPSSQGKQGRAIGEPTYVEDIIGWRPGTQYGWLPPEYQNGWRNGVTGYVPEYAEPSMDISLVIEAMRNPLAFVDKRYGMVDDFSAERGLDVINRFAESAPETAKAARMIGANADRYRKGLLLGRVLSGAGARLEPAGISIKDLLTNPYGYVKSKRQYAEEKNREKIKDEQLKKAIEEALKGGK